MGYSALGYIYQNGVWYKRDGTPLVGGGVIVLAQSAVPASYSTDTLEAVLATVSIPGGMIGSNGSVRVRARFSCTASANNKTFRTKLGGQTFISPGTANAAVNNLETECVIWNRGSLVSQIGNGDAASEGAATVNYTGTVNTSVTQNLTITGQASVAGEVITLEAYTVEILPG